MQEGGVGLFQVIYHLIVDDLDTARGRAFTAGLLVIARDGTEEPGARTFGFSGWLCVPEEYFTSAAVTSRPLWNFTPLRSTKV